MGPVAFVTLCLLGCLVCSPALAGPRATSCPRGWLNYHGACYGFFKHKKSWQDAEAECQQHGRGTHLASILSAGENNMLAGYVRRFHKYGPVWIGLSDPEHNQCWRWSDRSPATFTAWDRWQPDSPRKNEHCVVLERPAFNKWHDYPCGWGFAFLCKQGARGRQLDVPGESPALGQ
ncbi:C-type lectin-like [Pelodiscus sinensis]|uniref:C-type lectin-like n=1 Tax=Pelodiscus sinensis TaxID=13735 RepID=UPI003F6CF368